MKATKRDHNKPRRPLSAYNLFFRFKRQKILELCKDNSNVDRAAIESIVKATPGLENISHDALMVIPEGDLDKFRSDRIRAQLEDKLTPKENSEIKARAHRKTEYHHGLSFLDMTKIISSSWKQCDDNSKKLFEDLAEDGRVIRQKLLADYAKQQQDLAGSPLKLGGKDKKSDAGGHGKDKKSDAGGHVSYPEMPLEGMKPNAFHPHIGSGEGHWGGHNSAAEAANSMNYMQRMHEHGRGTSQHSSSAAAAMASAYSSYPLSHPPSRGSFLPLSAEASYAASRMPASLRHPNLAPSYNSLFQPQGDVASNSSQHADKVKIAKLEGQNESMKQMVENLLAANADLEGQKTHLLQLVGQLTSEVNILKGRNHRDEASYNHHPVQQLRNGLDVPQQREPPSVSSAESGHHHQEFLTSKAPLKKRYRAEEDK